MKKRLILMGLLAVMAAAAVGCGAASADDESVETDTEAVSDEETAEDDRKEEDEKKAKKEDEKETDADETRDASGDEAGQSAAQEDSARTEETQDGDAAAQAELSELGMEKKGVDAGVDSSAVEFVEGMKIGWNLGNTFDANTDTNMADDLSYESYWCGITTTKEMIDAVKAAGFETIRIPVAWHNHVSGDGSYTISEAWLNRVQEVVDYAIDNDMYVIINIHHDNSTSYMYPSKEYLEQSKAYVKAVWSQVAPRFADYDEHLIMEGLNEPRLVGTGNEWWLDPYNQTCIEAVECINELNQLFVDTVRAAGGNNTGRYLLVPGYAASLDGATNEHFVLPKDPVDGQNKILLEVHAYTPYAFALQGENEGGSTDSWSMDNSASTKDIDDLMDTLYEKYVRHGVGVVIDEFGARDKNGNLQDRVDFATYYIAAARARSITCCWWDNHCFEGSGERFGIFDRRNCRFVYPEIVEGLMKYCG